MRQRKCKLAPVSDSQLRSVRLVCGALRIGCILLLLMFAVAITSIARQAANSRKKGSPHDHESMNIKSAVKAVVSVVVYDKTGQEIGQASGFFVDRDGTLATNFHVIAHASSAAVKSADGRTYPVSGVLGLDKSHDLAVIKVVGSDFSTLPLADSDSVSIGDRVVAIGSPLGLENTVSEGLISGVRSLEGAKIFQTTAAISPGSSGGVLLNSAGQVIAITTFQLTVGQNLNFAVPANYLKPLLKVERVVAFAPQPEPTAESPKPPPQDVQVPPDLPRHWTNVEDGSSVSVKADGDYVHEQGSVTGDGKYIKEGSYICETKRQGDRWVGKCRYRVLLVWASAITENWCEIVLDETINSIKPTRIEGESQEAEPASDPRVCPQPGTRNSAFALIPQY